MFLASRLFGSWSFLRPNTFCLLATIQFKFIACQGGALEQQVSVPQQRHRRRRRRRLRTEVDSRRFTQRRRQVHQGHRVQRGSKSDFHLH